VYDEVRIALLLLLLAPAVSQIPLYYPLTPIDGKIANT